MNLANHRRIRAEVMKVGKNRVWFDKKQLAEIKEAITKQDIRTLVSKNVIQARPEVGNSRVRARKRILQRRKGRQQGKGTRKGKRTARLSRKGAWMVHVRSQRRFIKELKSKNLIDVSTYRNLYGKVKGHYFRNKRHIKLYLTERHLFVQNQAK